MRAPVNGADERELIKAARRILAKLCDEGRLRMSIPMRDDDEDMVFWNVFALAERASAGAAQVPAQLTPNGHDATKGADERNESKPDMLPCPFCGIQPYSRVDEYETEAVNLWNERASLGAARVPSLEALIAEWERLSNPKSRDDPWEMGYRKAKAGCAEQLRAALSQQGNTQ